MGDINRVCLLTGRYLGSWTIFKAKQLQVSWTAKLREIGEPDWYVNCSDNGWTNNILGLLYLTDHFQPQTKTTKGKKGHRILIVDGHDSHMTLPVLKFCLENKIFLLCLPPHTTHNLQPCDVGVFGPCGTHYSNMIREKVAFTTHYVIDKIDFLEVWH